MPTPIDRLHTRFTALLEMSEGTEQEQAEAAIAEYEADVGDGAFLTLAQSGSDVAAVALWAFLTGMSRQDLAAGMLANVSHGRAN